MRTLCHANKNSELGKISPALTGEAIGILAEYIYKKQPGELTEQEKENISA
ncbi:TPA: hypothetical protein ACNFOQ_001106 [Morganella morganii]